MKPLLVTIDGPAGAGKTTVSRLLAQKMYYRYVDTGALYRAVAYEAHRAGVACTDDAGLETLCRSLKLRFIRNEKGVRIYSGSSDITDEIRTPEITMGASAVSARPVVRRCLLDTQKKMAAEKNVVFEGRDMGTVVFPDADVKFFLDASLDVRAMRRYREFESKKEQSMDDVKADMQRRDDNDSRRAIAPLKPAADAIRIDSTHLSAQQVVEKMIAHIRSHY